MESKVAKLKDGDSQAHVASILSCKTSRMDQPAIYAHLNLANNARDMNAGEQLEASKAFRNAMTGEQIRYCVIESKEGFSSPILWKTKREGFCYTITTIFRDGHLFGKPDLSSDQNVNGATSTTIFDAMKPGNLLKK